MSAPDGPAATILGGAFGLGVFAMTRKQMLGIRDRAEAAHIAAGITAEFSGRWDEQAVQSVAEAADTAVESVAEAADTAVETARAVKPPARKGARKAAHADDEAEPTV
jgi:histone H3/H4